MSLTSPAAQRIRLAALLLLLLTAGARADWRVYSQLWQVDGWPLPDLEELDPAAGPAPGTAYPASIDGGEAWRATLSFWHRGGSATLGDGRPPVLDAPALPRAAGLGAALGPLSWRAGYTQRYSSRERITPADSALAAALGLGDWSARLDGWSLQLAAPLELPLDDGRRLAFRAGVGLEHQVLLVDQLAVQRRVTAPARRFGLSARLPLPRRLELALDYGWEDADGFVSDAATVFAGYPPQVDTVRVYGRPPEAHHLRATLAGPGGGWLSLRLHQVLWSRMLLGYRDRTEAALVAGWRRGDFAWQLGLASSGQDQIGLSGSSEARFLLAGLAWERGPLSLGLKLAESRLPGTVSWRRQTLLQVDLQLRGVHPAAGSVDHRRER
jgi:hypothetical protein